MKIQLPFTTELLLTVLTEGNLIMETTLVKMGITVKTGLYLLLTWIVYILSEGTNTSIKPIVVRYKISDNFVFNFFQKIAKNEDIESACKLFKEELIKCGTYEQFVNDMIDKSLNKQIEVKIKSIPIKYISQTLMLSFPRIETVIKWFITNK